MNTLLIYLEQSGLVLGFVKGISKEDADIAASIFPGETRFFYDKKIPERSEDEEGLHLFYDGVNFYYSESKQVHEPYQPSNAEVAQMISDLQVDLILAGVI